MINSEFRQPDREPDFEAEITALKTEEGGRKTPLPSGYRPTHNFGLKDMLNDGMHEYPDSGIINPGQKGRALIWLLCPDYQVNRLYVGMEFTVQEGSRIIGKGKIKKVLNPQLQKAS